MMNLYYGDCLVEMQKIEDKSVDLIFADLPYGATQNKWDIIIPFDALWEQFKRIAKPTTPFIFTATQPFTSQLVLSNPAWFKYEIIWKKTIGSGQLNIKRRPLIVHESVLVFYQNFRTYNEQLTTGTPYKIKRSAVYANETYGGQKEHNKVNDGTRHAKSVIEIANPRIKGGHPTEKPVELMEYIIRTYSNVGDIVLDPVMGRGTTGIAAANLQRNFIGIEKELLWYNKAAERIHKH